jgi:ADP-heptose:LPS heptosyltransferase
LATETAALLVGLDLVITADTALAHLAGALGVPVWVMLQQIPDWRWQNDRADSPWYPSMRLFRQRAAGDWEELFGRVAAELATQVRAPS